MDQQDQLMQDALVEAYRHTRELQSLCTAAGASFSAGHDSEAMEQLRHILDGIGFIAQAIHLTSEAQRARGIAIDLTGLPGVLEPVVEALENRDFGALGDLVHYEIEPILGDWEERLEGLTSAPTTSVQA